MLYGIISDIHSNLEALRSVLKELKHRQVNHIICLGDVVGYGANPNECCDIIREISQFVILGNHDAGAIGMTSLSSFNDVAQSACIWTTKVLAPKNREWLKGLPLTLENRDLVVHSSPSKPDEWKYIISLKDAIPEFQAFKEEVCFIGHSHVPITFVKEDSQYSVLQNSKFKLKHGFQHIINPGSIGQPRDADSRASFALYDRDKGEIEIVRTSYDVASAQQKIIEAGLPEFLAARLMVGI